MFLKSSVLRYELSKIKIMYPIVNISSVNNTSLFMTYSEISNSEISNAATCRKNLPLDS